MEFQHFILEIDGPIARFTANRPEVLNVLNETSWREIGTFAGLLSATDELRLAIITGAGERAFIAGADVSSLKAGTMVSALAGIAGRSLQKLADCPKPTIAAINGYAVGGGCELALACDIRIASENAVFSLPEVSLGILPGGGGTQRLSKIVGLGRAKEMILTGRRVTAAEALDYGLVTAVVPQERLMEAADELASAILAKGPLAVQLAKQCIDASLSTDSASGRLLELLSYSVLASTEDRAEGVQAFLEKRSPEFKGR